MEVFCRCDRQVARSRYRLRAGSRSAGHSDNLRTDEEIWNPEICESVAAGWPAIEVDTSQPVDAVSMTQLVRQAASHGAPIP